MNRHELRAYRERHGLSQEALAQQIQRSRRTIVYWEAGTVAIPTWLPVVLESLNKENPK